MCGAYRANGAEGVRLDLPRMVCYNKRDKTARGVSWNTKAKG